MSTPSRATARHFALAVMLLLFAVSLFAQSGPTTVRRDAHHDVSPPLSEMIKHAPRTSLVPRPVEPLQRAQRIQRTRHRVARVSALA